MIDPKQLAANTLQLLQTEPRNYRLFGMYWYFIKALLKRYYTKHNLYLLGSYVDDTVTARMPEGMSLEDTLTAALEEYQYNFAYGLGQDPTDADGETFVLFDQDANL
jgi:hypothetical protein